MKGLETLISAMGDDQFPALLVAYLKQTCGAQHCAILTYDDERPVEIASASLDGSDKASSFIRQYLEGQYWRSDPLVPPAISAASAVHPVMLRIESASIPDAEFRALLDAMQCEEWLALVGGGACGMRLAVSMFRSCGAERFASEEIARLTEVGPTLVAIAAKHAQMLFQHGDLCRALTSLAEIDACIRLSPEDLTAREGEVCARILYGMSTAGIASDLAISEQTVITYRKRAYQRLAIASQRELLLWYASRWNALHSTARGLLHTLGRNESDRTNRRFANGRSPVSMTGLSPTMRILMDLGQRPTASIGAKRDLSRLEGTVETR